MKLERLLFVAVSIALAACSDTTVKRSETETHFLVSCESSCEGGLSCICGVCTQACTSDGTCGALAEGASCAATPSACGGEVESACDVECTGLDDCAALGSELGCLEGRCRVVARGESGEGGQSGGGGSGGGGQSAGDDGGVSSVCLGVGAVCERHSACCGFEESGALCLDPDGAESEPATCFSTCDGDLACPSGFSCRPTTTAVSVCIAN